MNEFKVFTTPVMGGYLAMLRLPSDGAAKPVLLKGGKPEIFPTELAALTCATRHLVSYINGSLYRSGDIAGNALSAAEALFKPKGGEDSDPILKQKGKTRRIRVERKRRGRR